MLETKAKYAATAKDLYTIVDMTCTNCNNDIDRFNAHKKRYTPAYIEGIRAQMQAAQDLPNHEARLSTQTLLRNALARSNDVSCSGVALLMTYIEDSFLPEDVDSMRKLAGDSYYLEAANGNWQSSRTMQVMANNFINSHSEQLTAGDMSEDFLDTMQTNTDTFSSALSEYNGFKSIIEQQTAAKITANNALFNVISGVMQDGKAIFRKDKVKRKNYSYQDMLSKIVNKKSGFHFKLIDAKTKNPVETASLSVLGIQDPFTANKKGVIDAVLAEREYEYTLTAPGYATVQGTITVDKNVMHRLEIQMNTVAAEAIGVA